MRASKYNSLMDLAGQGASAGSRPFRSRVLDDRGYLMAVLLIGMAITAVWMSALLPAWRQQVTRQREQDLIFRGEQYARAVALYYVRNQCTLPTNVDDLVARKFLRKKWKDPITNDDFILVPGAQPGAQQPGGRDSGARRRGRTAGGAAGAQRCDTRRRCRRRHDRREPGSGPGRTGQPTTGGSPSGAFPGQSSTPEQSIDQPRKRHRGRREQEQRHVDHDLQRPADVLGLAVHVSERASQYGADAAVRSGAARRPSGSAWPARPAWWSRRRWPRRAWRAHAYRRPWRRTRPRRRVAAATSARRDRTWTRGRGRTLIKLEVRSQKFEVRTGTRAF